MTQKPYSHGTSITRECWLCIFNEYNGRQSAGFMCKAQQVFISKVPQEEAGSWFQGQAESHSQELQKGNSTKANNVVQEIRQEIDDRKSEVQAGNRQKKALLVSMAKKTTIHEQTNTEINSTTTRMCINTNNTSQ